MKLIKTIFVFLFLCSLGSSVFGQVSVQFLPSVHGQTLDGLAYARILNSSIDNLQVELTIRVKQLGGQEVVTIQVPSFVVYNGSNEINRIAFSKSRILFYSNGISKIVSQTQRFPEGEYEYCYEVVTTNLKNGEPAGVFENCFTHILQPSTPLLLVDPIDGDKLCNRRPSFSWQPPMPMLPGNRYRLQLYKLKSGQTPTEAIATNIPLINQINLASNILIFPTNIPDLELGSKYIWYVTVINAGVIITSSEIWTFDVECKIEEKNPGDSYRELKLGNDAGFYIANKILRFSFTNPYQDGKLNYSITSLTDPKKKLGKLPVLRMQTGLNRYTVDLEENGHFKKGEQYLLSVTGSDNRQYLLKFIYDE